MIPLEMSSREQEFLAQTCSVLRTYLYAQLTNHKPHATYSLEHEIDNVLDRFEIKPTDLDCYYDQLHRTGSNS